METKLLRPEVLNLDHIFGKVLLTLNDSFAIGERDNSGQIHYECHPTFWEKIGVTNYSEQDNWIDRIEKNARLTYVAKLNSFYVGHTPAFVTHVPILNHKKETLWYIVQTVRLGEITTKGKQSFLFMLKDVSAKRREHQLLKEGQRITRMGYWEWDIVKGNLSWSEITKEIHEVPRDFVPDVEKGINFYKEGESRDKITELVTNALEKGEPFETELILVTAKGNEVWVESRARVDMENGKAVRMYGTFQDISRRRKIEEQLRINEESFRGSFEHAAIGMAIISPEGEWLKVNKSVCHIVGYTRDELSKLTFADITHPEDIDSDLKLLVELVDGKRDSYQMEKRYIHKDGHIVWIILTVSMVKDESGKPLYFISQITDITQRKLAQEKLENAISNIKGILDASTHVSIIATDADGLIEEFNSGAENLLGYKAEEMIGKHNPGVFHLESEVIERGKELSTRYQAEIHGFETFVYLPRQRKFESREWTYVKKSGEYVPVQLVVTARRNEDNEIVGYLGMATDLRERKNTEELERQMAILKSKSEEMEQFAYITSHDLREPLLTISNYINLLEEEAAEEWSPQVSMFFSFISGAADRLNKLINGLLDYSRLSNIQENEQVNLTDTLEQVILSLDSMIKSTDAEIHIGDMPKLPGYPEHLYIMFMNLLQNAMKFKHPDRKPEIHVSCEKLDKDYLFEITDNGIGIEEKYHSKIFTIFQRLHDKSTYEGTGLGLALVKKITELHNGLVQVVSNESGEGCTFKIYLPASND